MDFFNIVVEDDKKGGLRIYPDFIVCRSRDLMVRAQSFYAIWDEEAGLWNTDVYAVQRLVDQELLKAKAELETETKKKVTAKLMISFSANSWREFQKYLASLGDNAHQLDNELTFQNVPVKKKDYRSKRLPYALQEGPIDAYEEIIGTLYEEEERRKIEWAIGSIVSGDSKEIQKFLVLYGEAGAGKSTILNIVQHLFEGYSTAFDAAALTGSNAFSTEVFRDNPLVAINHDGDLSHILDNTKLNSIVAHEKMTMNVKFKASYSAAVQCFLFMGTNKPVKITDAKSGLIRRLIDVKTSGKKVPTKRYHELMDKINFELGGIAHHCLAVYKALGRNYYSNYKPMDMILQTDTFFNFVEMHYYRFAEQDGITLEKAYALYKEYCADALVEHKAARHKFREEFKNYFTKFDDITRVDGKQVRSYFSGFKIEKFRSGEATKEAIEPTGSLKVKPWLELTQDASILDFNYQDAPAQLANVNGVPNIKWEKNTVRLRDINPKELHYVKFEAKHIVIDFDIKDSEGKKSRLLNLAAAASWPMTYAEYSKSGEGIHLHYFYEGDISLLSRVFTEDIEVKLFVGDASLRRKLTFCNNIPIATINSGLPLKEEKRKMINKDAVLNEKSIRELIIRNLHKEIHDSTKPSVDFINHILDQAYESGVYYNVEDLQQKILIFASESTNQSQYCVQLVARMKLKSRQEEAVDNGNYAKEARIVFFDVEVFPNLTLVVWKPQGPECSPVIMINPRPEDIAPLFDEKLIGFNNRRYDNHILYGLWLGYDQAQIYELSKKIVNNTRNALFGAAFPISYADVYEFSSIKQSLKKFQLDLGIHHEELGLPWDQPVDPALWDKVAKYCINDVVSLEAVFEDRKQDFVAKQILADLSGLVVNDTIQMHTAKILFGTDENPQKHFIYTDLSQTFPGYKFERGVSTYRGEITGEGGNVYAEPGIYYNVGVSDVASMHPTSIEVLELFGKYTKIYSEIKAARIAIKRKEYDKARGMLNGVLEKYLVDTESSDKLAYALKIIINIVYGFTSATFPNKFKDERNIDNIVAKRGALFMIDLRHAVQDLGFRVIHVKTDSIKIPDMTPEVIQFVSDFGKKYGYDFELEHIYSKMCLVNDAVFIAKIAWGKGAGTWTATGTQFAVPYVFKTLFSHEPITFEDLTETKSVTTALYLDFNENLGVDEHAYTFVGKSGQFVPILPGHGGALLLREKEGKYSFATGSKGYRWMEAEMVKALNCQDHIDLSYHRAMVDEAVATISKYGDFEEFVS